METLDHHAEYRSVLGGSFTGPPPVRSLQLFPFCAPCTRRSDCRRQRRKASATTSPPKERRISSRSEPTNKGRAQTHSPHVNDKTRDRGRKSVLTTLQRLLGDKELHERFLEHAEEVSEDGKSHCHVPANAVQHGRWHVMAASRAGNRRFPVPLQLRNVRSKPWPTASVREHFLKTSESSSW